jgi:glycosyltransferase involved in cell wall biosynthesis
MSRPRRVLVLAYYFPPLGGAGVQRWLKFVKYLPAHGFAPTVITTRSRRYPAHDDSLVAEIPPGTRVLRALDVPVPGWIARVLAIARLRRAAAVVGWPDSELPWALAAVWTAWREIRRERPDVILSTSAPYSAHLAGLALHRLTGIPWVADFRDEWAENPHARDQPRAWRALTRRAEAAVTRAASRVIVVADYFRIVGDEARGRAVITNGVDPDDFAAPPAAEARGDAFRLSFVGSLYGEQDPAAVLAALRRLIDRGAIDSRRFELRIVGNVWLRDFRARCPVPVTLTGYVDHERAIAEMGEATALLFYVAASSLAPSGKLFEYLAAERPIVCVANRENLAWRLVEELGAGRCAAPDDPAAIEAALADLFARWDASGLDRVDGVRDRVLERFSRRTLAGQVAQVLKQAGGG